MLQRICVLQLIDVEEGCLGSFEDIFLGLQLLLWFAALLLCFEWSLGPQVPALKLLASHVVVVETGVSTLDNLLPVFGEGLLLFLGLYLLPPEVLCLVAVVRAVIQLLNLFLGQIEGRPDSIVSLSINLAAFILNLIEHFVSLEVLLPVSLVHDSFLFQAGTRKS